MATRSEVVAGETPRVEVNIFDWGRRGWRVCVYQAAPRDDWNAMGRRLAETFCRTKASAIRQAKEYARTYGCALGDTVTG